MDAVVYELNLIREALQVISIASAIGAGYLAGLIVANLYSTIRRD